ncbi:hypothetical protein L1049_028449 [Liquidambar formosana]|uniref:SBP-type domain-containing protein n=1 Tax=Liquidambar formosana TaxID=63359 RepID=A0AAP0RKY2_LIQFO
MDWNLKTTSWDLAEFDQEAIPNMDAADMQSSFPAQRTKGNFSVDLKLGQISNSGDEPVDKWKETGVSKMASSPSSSSKRPRAASNGTQTVACLVDGCNSDLSSCKDYHRRHKVCELHSKTPEVTICGQKQRFCQQCSRFHSLEEFDEGKRSCRKRLDGHNRRRRKPQPEPLLRTGSFLSNYQGTRLFPFSTSQIYSTTSAVSPTWVGAGAFKAVEDAGLYNQHSQLHLLDKQNPFSGSSSSTSSYRGGKQFAFLQGDNYATLGNHTAPQASVCQPLLKSIASSQSGGGSGKMICDRLATQLPDSDCALSLLSSPPMHTSGISLGHMMQPNSIPLAQPLGQSLHYNSLEPMDSVLVSNASNTSVHCQGMFDMGSEESCGNEAPQTLPFYWDS